MRCTPAASTTTSHSSPPVSSAIRSTTADPPSSTSVSAAPNARERRRGRRARRDTPMTRAPARTASRVTIAPRNPTPMTATVCPAAKPLRAATLNPQPSASPGEVHAAQLGRQHDEPRRRARERCRRTPPRRGRRPRSPTRTPPASRTSRTVPQRLVARRARRRSGYSNHGRPSHTGRLEPHTPQPSATPTGPGPAQGPPARRATTLEPPRAHDALAARPDLIERSPQPAVETPARGSQPCSRSRPSATPTCGRQPVARRKRAGVGDVASAGRRSASRRSRPAPRGRPAGRSIASSSSRLTLLAGAAADVERAARP